MKNYAWNADKNELLKAERGLSFEDIVFYIQAGGVITVIAHSNQKLYPNQMIYVMAIEDYVYLVPFIETNEEIFLKTIIPSRKATKQYKGEKNG